MTRTQQILAGLLALQILLTAVVFWPRQTAATAGGALIANLDAATVVRLSIHDDSGNTIELARRGDNWVMANAADFPANGNRIEPVLQKIADAQATRVVANTAVSHKQLQVADDAFLRRVTLETDTGAIFTFYMGSAPGANATHVRRAGEDAVYQVNNLTVWELTTAASSWIDTTYIQLDRSKLTAATLENANGRFTFRKVNDEAWTLEGLVEGESLNQGNLNLILNRFNNLRLVRPLGRTPAPEYGMDAPRATLTLVSDGDESSNLLIGATLADGTVVIKWSASDYYATVSSFVVEEIINYDRAKFVNAPPEEESAPEETPSATEGGG